MKDVFEAILTYYDADSTLSGLAPLYKFYKKKDDGVGLPYVVMHLIDGNPKQKSDSYENVEKPYIQFSTWAETSASADAIYDALVARFDNAFLSYPGSFCIRRGVNGDVDEEGVWFYHVDYLIDNKL
jgi:hypothetical protein